MYTQLQIPYFPNSKEFSNYVDPATFEYKDRHAYYRFLGILPTASVKEIQTAVLKAYKKYHPDKGGSHLQEFEDLIEVKTTLLDPEKRKFYDATGFDKEKLQDAVGKITNSLITCAIQGATTFEQSKIILLEHFNNELKAVKTSIEGLKAQITKIEKLAADIESSKLSELIVDQLNKEIRALRHQILMKENDADEKVALIWVVKRLNGKTTITTIADIVNSLLDGTLTSTTATEGIVASL